MDGIYDSYLEMDDCSLTNHYGFESTSSYSAEAVKAPKEMNYWSETVWFIHETYIAHLELNCNTLYYRQI